MRVFIAPFVTATAFVLAACSGGTEGNTLPRSRSASATHPSEPASASGGASNASAPSPATQQAPQAQPAADPAPAASDAGTAAASAPAPAPAPAPAAPGTCGNPKCLGGNGIGGCKATDAAGDLVTMGCQDGACACFAGGQATTEFNGDVNSADDAAQLFLASCTCN